MIDWLMVELDTFDVIAISVVLLATVYFLFIKRSDKSINHCSSLIVPINPPTKYSDSNHDASFITRMQSEGRQVLIIFGSQTGTAEALAGRLSKDLHKYGKKALLIDPEEVDVEDFGRISEVNDALVVLCMATYNEGEPTDNALQFHEYITTTDADLSGVRYAVFGLGNKTYEHFNEMGKFFDRRLEELGAKRVYELGLGDDDGNLEEDFMRWREGFWPAIAQSFGWQISEEAESERQYRFEIVKDPAATAIFIGEYGRIGAFEKQRPPFDQKNPYLAVVGVNRELHKEKSDRSCRHIEFITNGARVRYEAGDHLGVFPTNDATLVEEFGRLLNVDMNLTFRLINLDGKNLFS
ncbi:unnamed protein product [Toxocara canis]|uniref:Flavodoxin-like domain-containing protein n=1 Tax=Toxocara canis TaxID=6265 RepID=A0A183VD89_TOXCA|nr:unnamed protein product [Toxocara canis]